MKNTSQKKIDKKTITVFISFIFLLVTNLSINAQSNFDWAIGMGGTSTDQAAAIDVDASGNVYSVGTFSGTASFDVNYTAAGANDGYIVKMDASGNYVWSRHLASNTSIDPNGIKVDATGNIYITGGFTGGVDFDMGVGTASLTAGQQSTFILKLDNAGNYLWAKKLDALPSPLLSNIGNSIDFDASGNVYITGEFSGTTDFDTGAGTYSLTSNGSTDVYIEKLDAAGNYLWAKRFGAASGDLSKCIHIDNTGNVYTIGSFQGTVDFDPGAGVLSFTAAATDIFISKLDANGNYVYAKQIGGSGIDRGYSICSDPSGNVYATGSFANSVDFNPGAGTYSLTATATDIFVLNLDAIGNFIWANKLGTGVGIAIAIDQMNNVFTTGSYSGTGDFNPGAGTSNLTSAGGNDIFISKLDNSGVFVSAKSIGSTGNDAGRAMTTDATGGVYIAGSYNGTTDFNPNAGTFNLTSFGGTDAYILKLSDCFAPTAPVNTTNISNQTICSGTTAVLSATSTATVNWYATSSSTTILSSGTNFTTPVLSAGTYTYYAAAFTCTTSTSRTAITVNVNASPTISVNSGSICSGNSFTINSSGANTYTISGGSAIVSPTTNTSYNVTGTSVQGCVSSNTAVSSVTVNAIPVISVNTGSICSGNSFTINPTGANTYTISGGSAVVSPTINTSYNVTGTSAQGCVSSNTAVSSVTVNARPTIAVNSGSICSGGSFTINPTGANTYTISGGSAIVSPTTNTSYNVTGTSTQGCVSSNTAISSVTVNAKPTISVNSGSICSGNSFTINPSGASSFTISGGSAIVTPTTNTSYNVTGTSAQGCLSSNTAVSSITVNAIPVVSVNSGSICSGNSFTINPTGANTYTISGGSAIVSPTTNTSYNVTGTSAQGCVSSNTAVSSVTVNAIPNVTAITNNTLLCTGQTASLTASGASTYLWNTSATTSVIAVTPTISTNYTVTGIDVNGCSKSVVLTQSVSACTGILVTEVLVDEIKIYPNPSNGIFTISGIEQNTSIYIYNAIGELVKSILSNDNNTTVDLSDYSNGVYFIKIKNDKGEAFKKLIKQ